MLSGQRWYHHHSTTSSWWLTLFLVTTLCHAKLGNVNERNIVLDTLPTHQFYINGTWVLASHDKGTTTPDSSNFTWTIFDPSNGEFLKTIAVANQTHVDQAVKAAQEAFVDWSQEHSPTERLEYVERLATLYSDNEDDLAWLLSREMGAPIDLATNSQVASGLEQLQKAIQAAQHFPMVELVQGDDPSDPSTVILQEPIGVVGLITPWNWPFNQIMLKLIPALLVGCTCVWKPSEEAPLSALLLTQLIEQAGFPPGVINVINGDGERTGTWLTQHPGLAMISFTGSTRAGHLIQQNVAQYNPTARVVTELGGKGAHLIFADAVQKEGHDEKTQESILYWLLSDSIKLTIENAGQTCDAPTRLLVEAPLYDKALEFAEDIFEHTLTDSAHFHGTHMGPVVNQKQYNRIQEYIKIGLDEGARLLSGGLGLEEETDPRGYYVQATVFADCTANMTIMQEEIFGPVICMTSFETEDEAVEIANDSRYGLTHYVSSDDDARLERLALRLQAGMVWLNFESAAAQTFSGGIKGSGNAREGGIWGLQAFCQSKAVTGLSLSSIQRHMAHGSFQEPEEGEECDGDSEGSDEEEEGEEEEDVHKGTSTAPSPAGDILEAEL